MGIHHSGDGRLSTVLGPSELLSGGGQSKRRLAPRSRAEGSRSRARRGLHCPEKAAKETFFPTGAGKKSSILRDLDPWRESRSRSPTFRALRFRVLSPRPTSRSVSHLYPVRRSNDIPLWWYAARDRDRAGNLSQGRPSPILRNRGAAGSDIPVGAREGMRARSSGRRPPAEGSRVGVVVLTSGNALGTESPYRTGRERNSPECCGARFPNRE